MKGLTITSLILVSIAAVTILAALFIVKKKP
jgi:hypothetical protein